MAYIKSRDYGIDGIYYVEYIKFSLPPWSSYFYTAFDYDFNGIKHITNSEMLLEYLDAYFRHNALYGEDKVTLRIEEVFDDYLNDYLENVPSGIFILKGRKQFLQFSDIKFHPQDYPRSILAHPSISYFYYKQQDRIWNELKEKFINEAWENYANEVSGVFIDEINTLIGNRKKVIWEVPHSIYKSTEPFSDDDLREGKIPLLVKLSKYEHEFYDYEIGFNERVFYKVVEHLPGGDYILNRDWSRNGTVIDKDHNDNNVYRIPDHDGYLCEHFLPFPYIANSPWCRATNTPESHGREGRFSVTKPSGGMAYGCVPNPGPKIHLIHQFQWNYNVSPSGVRGCMSSVSGPSDAGLLKTTLERSSDIRDYEPPKILETDEWYTTEHFGEYPSLEYRKQEHWWEDYHNSNITTHEQWHDFWEEHMLVYKDDLTWYINTHIDRENKL